jgi:hypothetical protein
MRSNHSRQAGPERCPRSVCSGLGVSMGSPLSRWRSLQWGRVRRWCVCMQPRSPATSSAGPSIVCAHLLRRHRIADGQTVDSLHARTDPHPRRLAPFGVVRRQAGTPFLGRVQGSDLPGQVVITRSGGELVQAHGHTPGRQSRPPRRSRRPGVPSVSALGVIGCALRVAALADENWGSAGDVDTHWCGRARLGV